MKQQRDWWTIPASTVRLLVALAALAAVLAGVFVYQRAALKERAIRIVEKAEGLAVRLPDAGQRVAEARQLTHTAREQLDAGNFARAEDNGEEAVALLEWLLDPTSEASSFRILRVVGDVEQRPSDAAPWTRLEEGTRLEAGSWVRTSENGAVRILYPNGGRGTIEQDVLVELRANNGTMLHRGQIRIETEEPQNVETSGLLVVVDERSDVEVLADADQGEAIRVHDGGALVRQDDEEHLVGAGQELVHLDDIFHQRKLPATPQLLRPADGTRVALGDEAVLEWAAVENVKTYHLQVSLDELFVHTLINDDEREKTSARLGTDEAGTFYWRVRAFDAEGNVGSWSDVRALTVVLP